MAPRLRKMKPYHPRKRSKNIDLKKQTLKDLERLLSTETSRLIVLIEEGNAQQIQAAQLKAKSDYLKHCNEMQQIAQKMGERYVKAVRHFLDSIDLIIHSNSTGIDEEKVRHCYRMTQELEKQIQAA